MNVQQQHQETVSVSTRGKQLIDITSEIQSIVRQSGIRTGMCFLFLKHTSASLVIQENADPTVLEDLERTMSKLIPEGNYYLHSTEGPDDMPAHLRTALTHTSEQIPITEGRLALGIWQAIYLWEHRNHAHHRQVVVHLLGD